MLTRLRTMKVFILLTLLVSLAFAAELAQLEDRARRPHKRSHRPKKFGGGAFTFRAAKRPTDAPAEYKVGTDKPSRKQSKASLQKLPAELIDTETRRRRDALQALRVLRRQSTAQDFYECQSAVGFLARRSHSLRERGRTHADDHGRTLPPLMPIAT